jgi:hypothetical protein
MRFGILSDLHIDLNDPLAPVAANRVLAGLLRAVGAQRPELLVLAGDVSDDYRTTLEALEHLRSESGLPCLFVAGNHDLWNAEPDTDRNPPAHSDSVAARASHAPCSWGAWQSYEALQAFAGNLSRGPMELPGGWLAVGDTGWYDYSFGDPGYSLADFERMQIDDRLWQDKVRAVWDRPTRDMHHWFLERLQRWLAAHRGRRIILVTHAVSHAGFTVRHPGRTWGYLNAFLGSPEYGELAVASGAALAVCGHVHYRRQLTEGPTHFVCNCLGYASEWGTGRDPAREAEQALLTLEL